VETYFDSDMDADGVLEAGCSLVALATGARWRRDGTGRSMDNPIPGLDSLAVYSPDDIMAGAEVEGPVVIYDDDQFYMGGVIAEALRARGLEVTIVTPGALVSAHTVFTLEQGRIQTRLLNAGVEIVALHNLAALDSDSASLACIYTGKTRKLAAASVVMVTTMEPLDDLYQALAARQTEWADHGIRRIIRIGDCLAPGTIAQAVWSGHRFARELGDTNGDVVPYRRENVELSSDC
jgi:dimethylamine/trimethylamine dehydrogenase